MKKAFIFLFASLPLIVAGQYPSTSIGYSPTAPVIDGFIGGLIPNTFIHAKGEILIDPSEISNAFGTGLYIKAENTSGASDLGMLIDLSSETDNFKVGSLLFGLNSAPLYGSVAFLDGGSEVIGNLTLLNGGSAIGYVAEIESYDDGEGIGAIFDVISSSTTTGNSTATGVVALGKAITAYGIDAVAEGTSPTAGNAYGIYAKASGAQNNFAGFFEGDIAVTGSFVSPSDRILKKNINNIDDALAKIMMMIPSSYEFKTTEYKEVNLSSGSHFGFIAQDMEKVFPGLVSERTIMVNREKKERNFKSEFQNKGVSTATDTREEINYEQIKLINYIEMIPILTKAIQEQQVLIETLQAEIKDLKATR